MVNLDYNHHIESYYVESGFLVCNKFPFLISRPNDYESLVDVRSMIHTNELTPFKKRLYAERFKTLKMVEYYRKLENHIMSDHYENEYDTLEEEHPEWLI